MDINNKVGKQDIGLGEYLAAEPDSVGTGLSLAGGVLSGEKGLTDAIGRSVETSGKSGTCASMVADMKMEAGYMAAQLNGRLVGRAATGVVAESPAPVLREGSRGPEVSAMQQKLAELGFSPGRIDGIFGPLTKAALEAFQRSRGITVDGICGPQTRTAFADSVPGNGGIPRTGNLFIDSIAEDAIRTQRQFGIPASVTIAQAILESGWGKSGLTRVANNYFGIKGEGPAGYVVMPTKEYINGQWVTINSRFRKYHSAAESFTDHAEFFLQNSRYKEALKYTNDPVRFAREIQRAGYATAPNYSDMLIRIMNDYGLMRFDQFARSNSPIE